MAITLLRINGTDYTGFLKANGGYTISRNDVDGENSGRLAMDPTMLRDRRAVKMKVDVECRPLTGGEARQILNDIYPEFVTVDYYDPRVGLVEGVQMYSNNVPAKFLFRKPNGTMWWDGIKFPLIER